MAEGMVLEVLTPERSVLREEVRSVVVPGACGYLGVLRRHAPMVVKLRAGVVKYRPAGREAGGPFERLAVSGGFLEVSQDRVLVLAPAAELAKDIDVMRARAARDRARARLRSREAGIDTARAQAALERALARLLAARE
ncbi:MAG: F0F1 ATP synthase subunit epsilon [Acetobacteraceae bacterium]|nr:F0F1 ATP synthase subunit epsilon [Acetobacteraceae bacterium]